MQLFLPAAVPPNCMANGLDRVSLKDADIVGGFLLTEDTSCCDGLSLSSAGLVLEL